MYITAWFTALVQQKSVFVVVGDYSFRWPVVCSLLYNSGTSGSASKSSTSTTEEVSSTNPYTVTADYSDSEDLEEDESTP